jgi:hypothetical protein
MQRRRDTTGGERVVWHRVDPRYLRQDDPDSIAVGYCANHSPDAGELWLWQSDDGRVTRFLLSHTVFPGGREYVAQWRQGQGVRIGEVDAGEGPMEEGLRLKMSPIVRYHGRPSSRVVVPLVEYFERHSPALPPNQREQVAALLQATLQTSLEREGTTEGGC